MAKRNKATKAEVQRTELNKMPVPDTEFAAEPNAGAAKERNENKDEFGGCRAE